MRLSNRKFSDSGRQMEKSFLPKSGSIPAPVAFSEVLTAESQELRMRRKAEFGEQASLPERPLDEPHEFVEAHRLRPLGVAFSGGGIRSATFNLGVLQGLSEIGLLPFIDYLSTVSGGGYIGAWLHGIIRNKHQ